MRRRLIPVGLLIAGLSGCGGSDVPQKQVPTAEQVRAFSGVVAGNCWRYRIPAGATQTFATVSVAGPDDRPIAGKSVYIRSYRSDSGNKTSGELLDFANAPEIRLARALSSSGSDRVTKTYEVAPLPLFGTLDFDAMNNLVYSDTVYRTTSTAKETGMAEDHQWTVLSTDEQVALHDGSMATAIKLSYQLNGRTAVFFLVPDYGIAKFQDFDDLPHQVCGACVSETDGGCTQAQCDALPMDCN